MTREEQIIKNVMQGWQCPICKRVYSPTTPMCFYCGNKAIANQQTNTL